MASVKLVLRTKQQDKSGHCPLYIRVIKDRKAKFISSGQKLLPSEWDEARQKVKRNHPNSARLNAFLSQKIADAEGQVADLSRKNNEVSAKKLKDAIKGKDLEKFFQYADDRLEKIKTSVSIGTHTRYTADLNKFKRFIGDREIFFEDISPVLLTDYMNYCRSTLHNGNNTIHTNLKTLKMIYRDAIKDDLASLGSYPFDKIKIKKDPEKLRFLVREQIDLIKNMSLENEPILEKYRDMFLFSVYAGGLRKSDILSLQWSHIDLEESRLSKKIRKTGHYHGFHLVTPATAILIKYLHTKKNEESFVFGEVKNEAEFLENPYYALKEIQRIGQNIKKALDKISKRLELPINLTFHMSRHTFATNALNNGMRIEHVSKIMDHSSITVTEGYAKVINSELDMSMEKFIY